MTDASPRRTIVLRGDVLYTSDGLPLYRFEPTMDAVLAGATVPWASEWPEFLRPFAYRYDLVDRLDRNAELPAPIAADVSYQTRQGSRRNREQATFRGWPLYLYCADLAGQPPAGESRHLFELATLKCAVVPTGAAVLPEDEPPVTYPPVICGP